MKNYIFIVDYNVYRKGLVKIENNVWHNVRNIVSDNVCITVWNNVWNNVGRNVRNNYKLFINNHLQQYKDNL
jgi:hypothetical protein